MTAETRRNILRYGIAVDLVILATGAGMLFDPPSVALLIGVYAGAVTLSSWRGGWKGAAAALALSIAVLLLVYPGALTLSHFILLAAISAIATASLLAIQRAKLPAAAGSSAVAEAAEPAELPAPPQLALVAPFRAEDETRRDNPAATEPATPVAKFSKKSKKKRRASDVSPSAPESVPGPDADRAIAEEQAAEQLAADLAVVAREAEEREAPRLEAEAKAAEDQARAEAERAAALAAEEQARVARELEQRLEAEREAAEVERQRAADEARARAERDAQARLEEEQRRAAELAAQLEAERRAAQTERERLLVEAKAHAEDEARRKFEEEQARLAAELEARLAREREESERQLAERLEAGKRAAEESARRQLEEERAAMRLREEALEAELKKKREEASRPPAAAPARVAARRAPSLVDTVTGWFRRGTPTSNVNLTSKRIPVNGNATNPGRRPAQKMTKPRLLMIERRRATADAVLVKLRQRGIEAEVVERWVDAVDEIFRFRPHALCLDVEHPDFNQIHRTISEKSGQLPIVLTGRSAFSAPASARHAAFVVRPYDVDELSRLAHEAHTRPAEMLNQQTAAPRPAPAKPALRPAPVANPAVKGSAPAETPAPAPPPSRVAEALTGAAALGESRYEVACYSCRASFSAVDADWCSCLAKERTLVCTNCLACFCKAPPSYKEKFWVEAPPRLFERKTAEARRGQSRLPENPARENVTRPLVLAVEDDEEIQAIVQRVCTNLGYGFIWATNGQDGLDLARAYRPNLILSDAFMPKLDGREMCRILKESNELPETRMVVMTGLYTDTKYRSEAVKRFHVDDYVAKPVAITELINILQKHLEGVTGLPVQEDLHEVHRAQLEEEVAGNVEQEIEHDNDIPLADIIAMPARRADKAGPRSDVYEVSCFNCEQAFEATRAEWCSCVGRDNTLLCPHCHGCFCKAPAGYRERFWIDAPSSLFERKMIGSKRQITVRDNPSAEEIKRPMILLVEDDENVQLIVRTVVSSMGYGFVVGANGQEGLSLAREYNPELILSDAFMPKLDGREMCRLLKEDPSTAGSKAIIMTGLYTDRKYRNEALDYFKVDDYVAKPLAVDDLIRLFKKHLPQEVARAN